MSSNGKPCNFSPRQDWSRWATVLVTIAIVTLPYAAQWGYITAQLAAVEKRLDELLVEVSASRNDDQQIDRRVTRLEGEFAYMRDRIE